MWQALINLCTSNASQSYWSAIAGESETEPWMRQKATNIFAAEADLSTQRASCTSSNPASSAFWTWTYGKTPLFFLKLALTRWNYGSLVCSVAATSGRTRRRQSPSFPAWITTCTDMYVSDWALGRSLTSNYPPRNPPQLWPMITLGCCCKRDTAKFRAKIPFTHFCFSKKKPIQTSLWIRS